MGRPVVHRSDEEQQQRDDDASHSLNALATEALDTVDEDDTEFSLEEKARQALECDCVAELRDGPCGTQFSEAFFCFLTSTAEEQGSDCIKPFIAMQLCMSSHPTAFTQYTGDEHMHERTDQESSKDDTDGHEFLSNTPPEEAIRTPRS